jgi:hypothetical protein
MSTVPKHGRFNGHWKGGNFRTSEGRVMIMAKHHPYPNHTGGYVFRYRMIMEKHLGRILLPPELVHHKNEVVDDDRIENLKVITRKDHINHHRAELTTARKLNGWGIKTWARAYDKCKICGRTDRHHNAHGLCHACYERERMAQQ